MRCYRPDCTAAQIRDESTGQCLSRDDAKTVGQFCPAAGNPINIGSGRKLQDEMVYRDPSGELNYRLLYTSRRSADAYEGTTAHGKYWATDFQARIAPGADGTSSTGPTKVSALRPSGQLLVFLRQGSSISYLADADIADRLIRQANTAGETTAWQLIEGSSDHVETYDPAGKLLSISDPQGRVQTLAYDTAGLLASVTDRVGRRLQFAFDTQKRIIKITPPDSGLITFTYDPANNLSTITWPDGKSRSYHYEDSRFPNNLTAINDKNGSHYATWTYDAQGRAVSSEHAGGADKVTLGYNTSNTATTDARGTVRTTNLTTILNVVRPTGTSQPGGAGCGPAASAITYDANGNVATRTDFNGVQTTYTYDLSRNLETKRIEASGKPESRTISSQWHSYWRLPGKVAEPKKLTTLIYNGDLDNGSVVACAPAGATVPSITGGTIPIGVLCKRSEQATTDANGSAGFSAPVTGTPRTWTYTYNQYGQVLTADGPRTDVSDVTTSTYYDATDPDLGKRGNLATITNVLGHITQITAYDLNGNPLSITDPNGTVTTLTYDPRQRLTSRQIGSELTSYQYDGVGQLLKITLPDNRYLSYTWDAAHRLTDISDALGNTIHYTLDAMDNRTREDVKDPGGVLTRTRAHVYDALSRLAQDIGAQNQITAYEYDANGNRTKVTDPLSHSTVSAYDALNRLIALTDPGAGITQLAWDGQDHLTQVTDPRSLITRYTVDGLGNRTQLASPDTGNTLSTYDAAGNEITHTDARGQLTSTAYDALNRPSLITFHDGKQIRASWDQGANGKGHLTQLDELTAGLVTGSLKYSYDANGHLITEIRSAGGAAGAPGAVTHTLAYTWNAGALAGLTLPSGRQLAYTRNGAGQITRINLADPVHGTPARDIASAIAYHPFGGLKSWTDGAGQNHTRLQDQDGRPIGFTLGTTPWLISYDNASRITGLIDGGNAANSGLYGYDSLDRLASAALPVTNYGYGYDPTGNRTAQTIGSSTRTYTTDPASNRLQQVTSSPPRTYSTDANGSIVGDGQTSWNYDTRGRLSSTLTAAGTTNYTVNALLTRQYKD